MSIQFNPYRPVSPASTQKALRTPKTQQLHFGYASKEAAQHLIETATEAVRMHNPSKPIVSEMTDGIQPYQDYIAEILTSPNPDLAQLAEAKEMAMGYFHRDHYREEERTLKINQSNFAIRLLNHAATLPPSQPRNQWMLELEEYLANYIERLKPESAINEISKITGISSSPTYQLNPGSPLFEAINTKILTILPQLWVDYRHSPPLAKTHQTTQTNNMVGFISSLRNMSDLLVQQDRLAAWTKPDPIDRTTKPLDGLA